MTTAPTLTDYANAQHAAGHSPATIRVRLSYLTRWADVCPDGNWAATTRYLATPGWSTQTRATCAGAIRSWLRWAQRHHHPTLLTPDDIDVPTVAHRAARPLPAAVIHTALARATPTVRLMILLGREAGLRRAEIAHLHTRDILPGPALLVHGKGAKDRIVPMSPLLADTLADVPAGFVFPRGTGHLTPGQVGYHLAAVLRGGTAHQLRHTFASVTYASNGHDIRAVQELLGHSSVTTTQAYVAVPADALRASVNAASLAAAA